MTRPGLGWPTHARKRRAKRHARQRAVAAQRARQRAESGRAVR